MPTLPGLLLDGYRRYAGPAPLFETKWDLRAALLTKYHDYSIRAGITAPLVKCEEDSVAVLYRRRWYKYPYKDLVVFNVALGQSFQLPNAAAARAYFESEDRVECPESHWGFGVSVFEVGGYVFR